ncbi:MAG TPA: PAS domain S-box protein [Dissulfurispiraceae bacterium]
MGKLRIYSRFMPFLAFAALLALLPSSAAGVRPAVKIGVLVERYWCFFLPALAGVAFLGIFTIWVSKLNQKLAKNLEELTQAEKKLQEQNAFMVNIIDSIPHPFYVINTDDYTLGLANKAANPHNLSGLTCYSLTHRAGRPCGGEEHPCTLAEVKQTKRPVVLEHIHYNSLGSPKQYEVHGYPVFNGNGEIVQVIEHSIDISERKAAEAQLRKLSGALEQSPNSIIITNTDGIIEYINPKFTETTGYTSKEAIGKTPGILKSGLTPPETYSGLWNELSSGREWHGEFVNRKKSGAIYWEDASISPVKGPQGDTTHFVSVQEDITERKLLNERFRQILSEHHVILENANIGIAFVRERNILRINKRFEELFGFRREEVEGRSAEVLDAARENFSRLMEDAYQALAEGKAYRTEFVMRHKDGSRFWCRILGNAIDPLEPDKGSIWIYEDISEQKEAEQQLKLQQQQLEELNRTLEKRVAEEVAVSREKDRMMERQVHLANLGTLAASITHEINTPLTYIKGNLELLKAEAGAGKEPQGEIRELFDSIDEGIMRISSIVDSMRHICGYSTKEKVPSNVFSTIIDASRVVYNRAKHISDIFINGRPFRINMDKNKEKFMAPVAAQSVSQVWIVILNNALDEFLKTDILFEKRHIRIDIFETCDKIHVTIRDNAGGIPEGMTDRIFDTFVSTKPQSGTGLGLHIAKAIIEGHGGTIRASNDAEGAVFEVALNKG